MSGAALAYQVLLLRQVITIFAAVGILFIPVGAVCLAQALSVRRASFYLQGALTALCNPDWQAAT